MKFSIIIPVYKTETYLRTCVESVLRQTYTDYEVILVDDGSPDACPMICDELCQKDKRIKVIHQNNSGPGIARNAGIESARGDYLLFLDSDDYWLKDTVLETANNSLHSDDLATFDMQRLKDGNLAPPDLDYLCSLQDCYNTGADFLKVVLEQYPYYRWYFWRYVFRRSLFSCRELRFSNQKLCEDVALLYRVILQANQVRIIKDSFYAYRQERLDSATKTATYETLHGILTIAEQEINRVQTMSSLSLSVRALLCSNFCILYYIVVARSMRLLVSEQKRIWNELESLRWITEYGRGREKKKAFLIRLVGVEIAARIIGLKWKLKKWG